MLELSVYDGIPHLLTPVVTDPKKAVVALKWTVREMEDRYRKMSKVGVRNIDGFNARVQLAEKKGEKISRTVQTGFDRQTGEAIYETEDLDLEPMPYIVVIIDEMADLMMVAGKDIEGAVQRLAQMARAAGIHLIMLDPMVVGEEHYAVARQVQSILQRYKSLQDIIAILGMPGSLEAYYQEIGRAGRDGRKAEAHMLYGLGDIRMGTAERPANRTSAHAARRRRRHL